MNHNTEKPIFLHVAVMGHSFISRLRSYVRRSQCLKNFNLDEERFEFKFFARGGLRISHIVNSRNFLSFDIRPDVCFLQIGENDICSGDEHFIARNILSLASYLHEGIGISLVIIGQLFRRQPWASSADFNNKIVRVNNLLKAASDTLPGVHFWHHRGFWSNMDFLSQDGVHLKCPEGVVVSSPMHKFWRSIRSAVLHFSADCRPV